MSHPSDVPSFNLCNTPKGAFCTFHTLVHLILRAVLKEQNVFVFIGCWCVTLSLSFTRETCDVFRPGRYCHVSRIPWIIIMGSRFDDWIYWHFFTVTTNYNSSQSMTRPFLTGLRVSSLLRDWLGSNLRIGHFFSFCCPLGDTQQLNTQLKYWTVELPSEFSYEWMPNDLGANRI
jgi:hypothetical protein